MAIGMGREAVGLYERSISYCIERLARGQNASDRAVIFHFHPDVDDAHYLIFILLTA